MSLLIREAFLAFDTPAVLAGAAAFAREADLADVLAEPGSPAFDQAVLRILYLPGVAVLLAEQEGAVQGGAGYLLAPYIWNPDRLAIDELFWWAAPAASPRVALALFNAMLDAGIAAGATIASCAMLTTSPPAVEAVYRRRGLRPIQLGFIGRLDRGRGPATEGAA